MANESRGGFDAESTDPTPGEGPGPGLEQPSNEQELDAVNSQSEDQGGPSEAKSAAVEAIHRAATLAFQQSAGKRVRRGQEERARWGVMPVGTGHGVLGYDLDPDTRRRVLNEDEAAIVLRVFNEFDEGHPIGSIARGLNEDEVPSKRGMKWGYAVVRSILQNSSYIGVDYYGKTRTVRGPDGRVTKIAVANVDCIRITGFSPPIVPEELFWRVQAKLQEWKTRVR